MSSHNDNPYIGPRAFTNTAEDRRLFFGREREARNLLALVVSKRLVLFYAQSGTGKSSLINTRLISGLEERGFEVLPVGRVGGERQRETQVDNVFVYNLLTSLDQSDAPTNRFANLALTDFLDRLTRVNGGFIYLSDDTTSADGGEIPPRALIIDQFEEILTTNMQDWQMRPGFFEQLNQAMQDDPYLWVVLTLREDYVAALDPYAHLLPGNLRARFYMERMSYEAALEAISKPAELYGCPFAPGVAQSLIDNLRRIHVGQKSPSESQQLSMANLQVGPYVEPVHLQVVCQRLWANLPASRTNILAEDVQEFGDVDQALIGFYKTALRQVVNRTNLTERQLRTWVDIHLITPARTRGLVLSGVDETAGLPNLAINILNASYLIRAEIRGQDTWYELAHDRLVEPIQTDNAIWFEENLSPLQRQAELWDEQGRPSGLLLRDEALETSETWAETQEAALLPVERDFLAACHEAREISKREQQQAHRIRMLAMGATIVSVIAIILLIIAFTANQRAETEATKARQAQATAEAEALRAISAETMADTEAAAANRQAQINRSRQVAAQALNRLDDLDQALLFSLEAHNITDTVESRSSLLAGLTVNPHLSMYLHAHTDKVFAVAFNPDPNNPMVASAGQDQTIILWDPTTGQPLGQPLRGHREPVWTLAFSPDGKTLASAGRGKRIILWALDSDSSPDDESPLARKIGDVLIGHTAAIRSLAFSPDGKLLASGSDDRSIILWDVETQQPLDQPLKQHDGAVSSLTFNPDQNILASGGEDKAVILWDLSRQEPLAPPLTEHTSWVNDLAFSPDGQILASGGEDHTIILWDVAKKQPLRAPLRAHQAPVRGLAFGPDGHLLASSSNDKSILLWDVAAGQPQDLPLTGHSHWVYDVAFSPDGQYLVSGSSDHTVILWEVNPQPRFGQVLVEHPVISQSGASDATGQFEKTDAEEETDRSRVGVSSLALNVHKNMIASAGRSSSIMFWDMLTGEPVGPALTGHGDQVNSLAFSPDGQWLASGSSDNTIIVWDVERRKIRYQNIGHNETVNGVAFSPDGIILASSSNDDTVRFWEATSGQPITGTQSYTVTSSTTWQIGEIFGGAQLSDSDELPDEAGLSQGLLTLTNSDEILEAISHENDVRAVAFSADGSLLASGSNDKTVILWDVTTGRPIARPLTRHTDKILSVAFSPDGTLLATGSDDDEIILWDMASRQPRGLPLIKHVDRVSSLAFSPDGKLLASGSQDATIILWDLESSQPVGVTLTGHTGEVTSLIFDPDGRSLFSGSQDGTIIRWDLQFELWQEQACEIAGRNLTWTEWGQLYDTVPYRKTCPGWPIHPSVIEHARELAQSGDGEGATTLFQHLQALDATNPDLNFDPVTETENLVLEGKAVEQFENGKTMSEKGDYQKAIDQFGQAIEIMPEYAEAYNHRAIAYYRLQDYEASVKDWTRAIELEPENAIFWRNLGLGYHYFQDYEQAINSFSIAIELDPGFAAAFNGRAGTYYTVNHYERAITDYERATELDPGRALYRHNLAYTYYYLQQYDQAIDNFTKAIELAPNYASAYNGRGNAFDQRQDYEAAINDYLQAIELAPDLASAYYYNLGLTYSNLNDYEQAIVMFDRSIERNPEDASAYSVRGTAYRQLEEYEAAIKDYLKAIELVPDEARYYRNLGRAYYDQQDYGQAIEIFTRAIELAPDNAVGYSWRGNIYYRLKNYKAAIEDFTQAIVLNPNYALAYNSRGAAYDELENYGAASEDYRKAIDLEPEEALYRVNLANIYYAQKDYDRTIELYTEAIELEPDYASAYYNRGNAYYTQDNFEAAVKDYTKAIEIAPETVIYLNNRGNSYRLLEKYEAAIKDYSEAIRLDPTYALAYYGRGRTYYDKGEYDQAIENFDQSIALNPRDVDYYRRGWAYAQQREYEKAIVDFDEAIRLDPGYADAYNGRGAAYRNLDEFEAAVRDLTEALKLDPDYEAAYYNLGLTYYDQEEYDQALENFVHAVDVDSDDPYNYYWRGRAYLGLNEIDEASNDFAEFIKLDPGDATAYNDLGGAYAFVNDYEQAVAHFQKAIDLEPEDPDHYNSACWHGSLLGHAQDVLEYCEQAVKFAQSENKGWYRDSRGLARALSGNVKGAIEDFSAFVAWSKVNNYYKDLGVKREQWIADLEDEKDPFDAATLKELQNE